MKLSMEMFMAFMFIVGLVICVYAFKTSPLTKDCSLNVQNAARGLLVLGVIIVTMSTTYMICGCGAAKMLSESSIGTVFVSLMLVIGIIVVALTSIIRDGCSETKHTIQPIMGIGVLMLLFSLFTLGYQGYTGYQKLSGSKNRANMMSAS